MKVLERFLPYSEEVKLKSNGFQVKEYHELKAMIDAYLDSKGLGVGGLSGVYALIYPYRTVALGVGLPKMYHHIYMVKTLSDTYRVVWRDDCTLEESVLSAVDLESALLGVQNLLETKVKMVEWLLRSSKWDELRGVREIVRQKLTSSERDMLSEEDKARMDRLLKMYRYYGFTGKSVAVQMKGSRHFLIVNANGLKLAINPKQIIVSYPNGATKSLVDVNEGDSRITAFLSVFGTSEVQDIFMKAGFTQFEFMKFVEIVQHAYDLRKKVDVR